MLLLLKAEFMKTEKGGQDHYGIIGYVARLL